MVETEFERLSELYDLREAFETHIVGSLALGLAASDLKQLQSSCKAMVSILEFAKNAGWDQDCHERWLLAEAAFHLILLRACGNSKMLWVFEEFDIIVGIFGTLRCGFEDSNHDRVELQHRELLETICYGNVKEARRLITQHIRAGKAVALKAAKKTTEVEGARPLNQNLANRIWLLQRELVSFGQGEL